MAQAVRKMGQLAQVRVTGTSATAIYQVPASRSAVIDKIILTNVTSSAAVVSLFHDDDATTYDENSALVWLETIEAKARIEITNIKMDNTNGRLALKQGTTLAINATVYGSELEL